MCIYCEKFENSLLPIGNVDAKIKGKTLILSYDAYSVDSSFDSEMEIDFCPMCGSKLKDIEIVRVEENERIKKEIIIFDLYDRRNVYCKIGNEDVWIKAENKREAKNKLNCALNEIKCLFTYRDLELRDMTEKNHSA